MAPTRVTVTGTTSTSTSTVRESSTAAEIRALLVATLSEELRIAPDELEHDRTFTSYGADSLTAMTVAVELEDTLGLGTVPPTLLWDCPTIDALVPALELLLDDEVERVEAAA